LRNRQENSNPQIFVLQIGLGDQLLGGAAPNRAAALDDEVAIGDAGKMFDVLVDCATKSRERNENPDRAIRERCYPKADIRDAHEQESFRWLTRICSEKPISVSSFFISLQPYRQFLTRSRAQSWLLAPSRSWRRGGRAVLRTPATNGPGARLRR